MEQISKLALEIYKTYGTSDPFRIAEEMGIRVFYSDLPDVTSGLYYYIKDKKVVLINQKLDERQSRITMAHELGHAILHPEINYVFMTSNTLMKTERYEQEADYFCACLLMCARDNVSPDETCEDIACTVGLPIETVNLWMEKTSKNIKINTD